MVEIERLSRKNSGSVLFALWTIVVLLIGTILTSYHQPFRGTTNAITTLSALPRSRSWHLLHVVSGGCGCSQVVMRHLLQRKRPPGVDEEMIVVDGDAPYLPGSEKLLSQLQDHGFVVTHKPVGAVSGRFGLLGVPLLVIVNPNGDVAYNGGYGMRGDKDLQMLEIAYAGGTPETLPVQGCAIGKDLRRRIDPFHLKY